MRVPWAMSARIDALPSSRSQRSSSGPLMRSSLLSAGAPIPAMSGRFDAWRILREGLALKRGVPGGTEAWMDLKLLGVPGCSTMSKGFSLAVVPLLLAQKPGALAFVVPGAAR